MRSQSELSGLEQTSGTGDDVPARDTPLDDRTAPKPEPVSFRELVRSEFEWVWRLLRRIGLSPADADDACQQVFLVAARRRDEVRGARARPFLYGTALRVASNARRSLRRRRETPSESIASTAAPEPPLDELLEQRRARELLDELLGKLPDELRRVLVLAEIEQLTLQQIAELESIPHGTAASRLRRARAAFDALLEREQQRNPFAGGCP